MNAAKKRDWWSGTSAADDGDLVVESDRWDETSQQWLDDFDFDEFTDDDQGDFIGRLWDRYSTRSSDAAVRVASALKLVQGLVDTFATGDLPYRVSFDESVGTAGTNYKARQVVISHRPLFDSTLTAAEAETVLTAMGVHEASHVRYGKHTSAAVTKEFQGHKRAHTLSNGLDDVRIERRFARDYPGYEGVFDPALRYVAESDLLKHGKVAYTAREMDPLDVAIAAMRFTEFVDWAEREEQRDWWTEWAARWTRTDKVADHVAGVREGLAKLDEEKEKEQDQKEQSGESGSGDSAEQGASGSGSRDGSGDESQASATSDESDESDESGSGPSLPGCYADAIDATAQANDPAAGNMVGAKAQFDAELAKALVTDTATGERGEVYWRPGGIAKRRVRIDTDGSASAAIRSAFARSRTGHYDTTRNLRSGRIDNRSLSRIASDDYRLFAKRSAQSEGKYLVWLMVDCSGSMNGWSIIQASRVATALATASRFVPNMRLDIWGWTDAWRFAASFGAVRVWTTGDPIANVGFLPSVGMGGTPDAEVLRWAARAIKAQCRPGEQPLIVIASDGAGTLSMSENAGQIVDSIRRSGVAVVSVAIGHLDRATQVRMYGDKNYIGWQGSIRAMARPLGELLARVTSGHSTRAA